MKSKHNLRFALRNSKGCISSIWRVWTNNNDIYLGVRSIAGDLKTSLHESGQCQTSLTTEFVEGDKGSKFRELNRPRHIRTWKAVQIHDGIWHLLDIVVPHDRLKDAKGSEINKEVIWVETSLSSTNTQFSFLKRDTIKDYNKWVGKNATNTSLLYRGQLKDGKYFEIVFHGHTKQANPLNQTIVNKIKNSNERIGALQISVTSENSVGCLIDTPP